MLLFPLRNEKAEMLSICRPQGVSAFTDAVIKHERGMAASEDDLIRKVGAAEQEKRRMHLWDTSIKRG